MKRIDRNFAASGMRAVAVACCLMLGTAASAAAPAPAPSSAVTDDPAKVATAKEFIMLAHPRTDPRNVAKMLDRGMARVIAHAKSEDPKLDAKKFEQETRARMMGNAYKKLDIQAHAVSRHFTMPELKALVAFYSSPLGRKLTAETPKIQQDVMKAKWVDRIAEKAKNAKSGTVVPKGTAAPAKSPKPQQKPK